MDQMLGHKIDKKMRAIVWSRSKGAKTLEGMKRGRKAYH
jgi:hypothetical protein